jgi:hypothetical protein
MRETIRKQFIFWLLLWGCLSTYGMSWGQTPGAREYELKAAFLYNFTKFVEWPASSFKNENSPFVLGILGVDPFGSPLDSLKDKTVKGHKVTVRYLTRLENFEDCHLLYISGSEKGNLRALLATLKQHPILTISDLDLFANQGGMIGLVMLDNRIQFEVNLDPINGSKLKISSQLLKLAKAIHGSP